MADDLAFGEKNIKGRIMNILNYKKPTFWVVIAALVAAMTIFVGPDEQSSSKKFVGGGLCACGQAASGCRNRNSGSPLFHCSSSTGIIMCTEI